jgi:uncharacterized protein (DUF1501 family)
MALSQTISRRGFLTATSALGAASAVTAASPAAGRARSCIVLLLVGGPSQLETWDPKPDAPSAVRGPFGSIATSVTGVRISEHLPRLASAANRYAIVRSVHHDGPAIHEAGLQLLQTGRLSAAGEHPHFGSVLSQHFGPGRAAPFMVLPSTLGNMGINVSHGQGAGTLGRAHEPMVETSFAHQLARVDRDRYGKTAFGDACARSVQLVEAGSRCVVVNMFASVYDRVTWDCHADRNSLSSTLDDYRRTLCPTFDRAFATLLDDLHQRGLLAETLVVAMGEIGRTPRLNGNGGRDHWTGCWSIVLAGGGVRGGQVIGASDRLASEPAERPVSCPAVLASIYHAMGLTPLLSASPVRELFA